MKIDHEWGFEESPDKVDMARIWHELNNISLISAKMYLSSFRENAPKTYKNFELWLKEKGITL